jgi:alkylation response protein AidB-like acyl-CoA dehydrogenase
MNFDLTDDQVAIRDGIRSLCEGRFPMKRVRDGFDRATWDELAEAGVFSFHDDGLGWADAAIVFEELGRALVSGPLAWGVVAHGVVDGIVTGIERPADGGAAMVEYPDLIDGLVVLDGAQAVRVAPDALDREALDWPLDPLVPLARVASLPAGEPLAGVDVTAWRRHGALLTAAYAVGIASVLTEISTAYAKERVQFDRPIGSFQAVKHLLADMLVRAETARVSVHAAAVALDDPEIGGVDRALSGAKALAGEAAVLNAKTAVQVHGGMGFTWEADVHLYLKRSWVLAGCFGGADEHAEALAARL